ncbi:hypothetical protein LCGC14_1956320 [marine sediment metagenome]|uniref:RNA polymerase sigma factor 70 region 4 type 2 domain-containing protein n=1 Tax=marine sediment metagenome TaxID=412755 RepID=A0A0F9FFZ1_9ZZZZ
MSQDIFDCITSIDRKRPSCRCCHPDWRPADDVELAQLFEDLAQTLFSVMDYHDAVILVRYEVHGQTLSSIACETGCSRSEATRRLAHARSCFCNLVVLTLMPERSE